MLLSGKFYPILSDSTLLSAYIWVSQRLGDVNIYKYCSHCSLWIGLQQCELKELGKDTFEMVSVEPVSRLPSASLSWTRVQGPWVVVPAYDYLCYTQIIFWPSDEFLQREV